MKGGSGGRRRRLDLRLVSDGLAPSRARARLLIEEGKVLVNGIPAVKPGTMTGPGTSVRVREKALPFVSRGGLKLAAALEVFDLSPSGRVCMDVGASTGGFTDCLLQNGARRVYAVDVGYGQLAWSLRNDRRVVVMERVNIRYLPREAVAGEISLAVLDTSFISLRIVTPAVLPFLSAHGEVLALIKPQFEVGKGRVGKGGVVRDPSLHQAVIRDLSAFFSKMDLWVNGVVPSPVPGPAGNREFLIHLSRTPPDAAESPASGDSP